MTSTFSSGQKRKRSYSEPLSTARDRRIIETDHVDHIERITPAARVRRRSMEPSDSKKNSRLAPVSSPNTSITRRWHRSESLWTHHYQTEIPLSCSSINVITTESRKSRQNHMDDIRVDMWPKAGSTDHLKGMGNGKREGGGYTDHIHHESKAGTRNVPRIRKLKKATADQLHASSPSPSDNKDSEAVLVFPTLKMTGRKTYVSFYFVISSAIMVLLLLFMPLLVEDMRNTFGRVRAANLSFIFQSTGKCASFAALTDSDDILGTLSPTVFLSAGKNTSESKWHIPVLHEDLMPTRRGEMREMVTEMVADSDRNSQPIQTDSMLSSDNEGISYRLAERDRNLQDKLSSLNHIKEFAAESSEVSRLASLGLSKNEFHHPSVTEASQTVSSDGSNDISSTPSVDCLTEGTDKSSYLSVSAPTTSIASLMTDIFTPSTEMNRDIAANTDTNVTDEVVNTTDDTEVDSAHCVMSPNRSGMPSGVGEEEMMPRLKSASARARYTLTLEDADDKGGRSDHYHYGVDYAVWPRGGRVARPGVAVSISGASLTLTSPPHVLSLGPLKRIQHKLHLDGVADESIIISTELSSRSAGGYSGGNAPVHDLRSNCFIFSGSIGSATVIMHSQVNVSALQIVSYNAPYSREIDTGDRSADLESSAPKTFTVTGWSSDPTQTVSSKLIGHDLGTFEYVRTEEGADELQTFLIGERKTPLKAVTVSVLSNHGADYTSLCRVKIRGTLLPSH
jgi:Sad1 / UNC-like C-terminal